MCSVKQSDMESVALFAAGVPLWRMLVTPVCLCLVGAVLKLAGHNYLVPYGSSQYDTNFLATMFFFLVGFDIAALLTSDFM